MPLPSMPAGGGGSLLDLEDIFGGGGGGGMPAPAPAAAAASVDLLADIFSSTASVTPTSVPSSSFPPAAPTGTGIGQGMGMGVGVGVGGMDLLGMGLMPAPSGGAPQSYPVQGYSQPPMQMQMQTQPQNNVVQAFDKGGLEITMEVSKPDPANPASSRILSRFSNRTAHPMEALSFQAAVPKYLKLEMLPASSTVIPPHSMGAVTQEIRITNSMQGEKTLMLKLKVGYTQAGVVVDEMAQVASFPPGY